MAAARVLTHHAACCVHACCTLHAQVASARKEAAARVQQVLSSFRDQQAAAAANSSSSGTGASGAKAPAMSQAAAAAAAAELAALQSSIQRAIVVMQEGLVERETEVRLILLAALAGEHMLLIGPPGTAKSEVARRLNTLVTGTYFERLLTRFSVPEVSTIRHTAGAAVVHM